MPIPDLPFDLSNLPPPPSEKVVAFLPILEAPIAHPPQVSFFDEFPEEPVTPPRQSGFVTTVEWPLRPGDTRIEAYFIGTNRNRTHWFLWQFTMNDLAPFTRKYLEKRLIVRLARQGLSKRDAAALMLKAVWEFERDEWDNSIFDFVTDAGILDSTAAYAIAELVWGADEDDDEDDD